MSGDPRLHGRDTELHELDQLCDRLKAGESAALVIRGQPGMGKTALLRQLASRARAGFRVAEIAGVEAEAELAYAALHQLCSPWLDRLEALPEPQQAALRAALGITRVTAPDRFLVGLATLSLMAEVSRAKPLLCLVDDAQWLDAASSEVLGFVARRLDVESVALVFGVRTGEDHADRGHFAALPEMRLGGLRGEDARKLLATVVPGRLDLRVCARVVAETGGNPLALLELSRGMGAAELAAGFGLPLGGATAGVESLYIAKVRKLPEPTQLFLLLAACEGLGDATTLWRAAGLLGIGTDAALPEAAEGLLEVGARVRFRHPLVRSAVYRSAPAEDRRVAHEALAEAIDREVEPDRRAWHRAHSCLGPDEEVAAELEASAERAQARGGFAAAAALLERSAGLTPAPDARFERRLAAVRSHTRAGAFDTALGLAAMAESEATDELARARLAQACGQIASASDAGGDAPLQLLSAAKRLERLDSTLASRTYLDALAAAMFAGHLATPGGDVVTICKEASECPPPDTPIPFGPVLTGLVLLVTEGLATAEPVLREALGRLREADMPAESWLHHGAMRATTAAAAALWDLDSWEAMSGRQVQLARELGALSVLPTALNGLAVVATWKGDFETAGALTAEHDAITQATGMQIVPYGAMLLSAYRGRTDEASALIAAATEDSIRRGEGLGVDLARLSTTILNNGVGRYAEAMAASTPADPTTIRSLIATWMLPERVEAAVHCREPEVARAALHQFLDTSNCGSSDWGLGIATRCRALLAEGDQAQNLHLEAIERLGRAGVRVELARTHLVFGEWLRRENRRGDAREHLRTALEMFEAMSAEGFAERSRRELLATGEHVRARQMDTRVELTAQEDHIARLARDGRTNPEIAAELFLSARTVEWHLGKVFTKLGISSRRGLKDVLPSRGHTTPVP
ncbi:LuxR family transcriptional regulator [Intrasporangium mesophilum]